MADRTVLEELARLHGVETSFHDGLGQHRTCSDDSLVAVLRSLGAPLSDPAHAADALRAARQREWQTVVEPVTVVWGDDAPEIGIRLPRELCRGWVRVSLALEGREPIEEEAELADLPIARSAEIEGAGYRELRFLIPHAIPIGRHRVLVDFGSDAWESWLLAAPHRVHVEQSARHWGLFAPLYAIWSKRSTGAGDLSDLGALVDLVGELGGGMVATLPLCASFLGEVPHDPSPYAPVSRLFWNELYLDPTRVPELASSERARALLSSDAYAREADALRGQPMVDHRRQMALRRRVLEELADTFFDRNDGTGLASFVEAQPRALDYARFRATTETRGEVWYVWPERMREGLLEPGDWDERALRYHLWVQWRMTEQLREVSDRARNLGAGIYLDMPLGVHPDGYDAWRERDAFLSGCAAGAPPDMLFTAGQNWGFAPLSPTGMRADGYRYLTDCLRLQMELAGVLRIDHVMGLHRIYCVPPGANARDGAYIRYRAEELYAVLCTESAKHRTLVVGEDLGTVPPEVREAMERHGLHRMYVFPFELRPGQQPMITEPREDTVASMNTHDMPSFEAWFTGRDVDDRVELGLVEDHAADGERRERWQVVETLARELGVPAEPGQVLRGALERLASSQARLVLVGLEDLWLEPDPQNVPGTSHERPNWKRRARHSLDELRQMDETLELLRELTRRRG